MKQNTTTPNSEYQANYDRQPTAIARPGLLIIVAISILTVQIQVSAVLLAFHLAFTTGGLR